MSLRLFKFLPSQSRNIDEKFVHFEYWSASSYLLICTWVTGSSTIFVKICNLVCLMTDNKMLINGFII